MVANAEDNHGAAVTFNYKFNQERLLGRHFVGKFIQKAINY